MSAPAWRAKCWGGPLDGNQVWMPAAPTGMPQSWVQIEQIQIDHNDDTQALPHELVIRHASDVGFYVLDETSTHHPAAFLTYRWHDMQVSLRATTSSEGGA